MLGDNSSPSFQQMAEYWSTSLLQRLSNHDESTSKICENMLAVESYALVRNAKL